MGQGIDNQRFYERSKGNFINEQRETISLVKSKQQWSLLYLLCLSENERFWTERTLIEEAVIKSNKSIPWGNTSKLVRDFFQFDALLSPKEFKSFMTSSFVNDGSEVWRNQYQAMVTDLSRMFASDFTRKYCVSAALILNDQVDETWGSPIQARQYPNRVEINATLLKSRDELKRLVCEKIDWLYASIDDESYLAKYSEDGTVYNAYKMDVDFGNAKKLNDFKKCLDVYFMDKAITKDRIKYRNKTMENWLINFIDKREMPDVEIDYIFLADWNRDSLPNVSIDRMLREYRTRAKAFIDTIVDGGFAP